MIKIIHFCLCTMHCFLGTSNIKKKQKYLFNDEYFVIFWYILQFYGNFVHFHNKAMGQNVIAVIFSAYGLILVNSSLTYAHLTASSLFTVFS